MRRILAATFTNDPHHIRARAILMLLAIYGLRATELATLRLDQVDWQQRVIRIFRLKRRRPQVYPLFRPLRKPWRATSTSLALQRRTSRYSSATRTYAKVNLAALREVVDFDLGDLQ